MNTTKKETFPWLTKKVEEKMKGLNWARQNNKPVWYDNEPMTIVLSLRPIDEDPPDYIIETKDGEHLKVNLLNRKLLYYKKGTEKPNLEEDSDLLGEGNIDVSSTSKLSTRMQNHISSLSSTKKSKTEPTPKTKNIPIGATAQNLLNSIDIENERTEDLMAEINLYFQFFGSDMFRRVENAAISELSQIGIAAEPHGTRKKSTAKKVVSRKKKRQRSPSPVATRPKKKTKKQRQENAPKVKHEKSPPAEMRPHIVKILNTKLGPNQDFYLTFNCIRCHGIFTSVIQPGERVEHLCTSAGNQKISQEVRPKGQHSEVQALQVAVV